MKTIALVGATGYLGAFICQSLRDQGYEFRCLAGSKKKLIDAGIASESIRVVDFTSPSSLEGQLVDIDCVISCLGSTRQQGQLSKVSRFHPNFTQYRLRWACVKKFIHVSIFGGELLRDIDVCNVKEHFVDYLKQSGLVNCVVRSTGFFSDMQEFLDMARKGRVYLFGYGSKSLTPFMAKI